MIKMFEHVLDSLLLSQKSVSTSQNSIIVKGDTILKVNPDIPPEVTQIIPYGVWNKIRASELPTTSSQKMTQMKI